MQRLAESPLQDLFDESRGAHERAVVRRGEVRYELKFGACRVELAFAGPELADVVLNSLAHRITEPVGADVQVRLFEDPDPISLHWSDIGPAGLVRGSSQDGVSAVCVPDPGVLTLFDRRRAQILYRVRDLESLPWWERAAPMRPSLHFAFTGPGSHFVHGAVVGHRETGGVLIAGVSGSGKTTLALAAADHGMRYVGDDYVLLQGRTAWNVYRTAKVDVGPDMDKVVVSIPDSSLIDALPVRALVAPVIRGGPVRLRPISAGQALLALAPSTAIQMPFDRGGGLAELGETVRSLPCYQLELGRSTADAVQALEEVLSGG